jgi:membrane protein implicated in regulation of membrane protease activity
MSNSFFKQNEHAVERLLRVILGAVLLALVFVGPQTPFGWIGVIPLVTGIAGTCPLYSILGISTCSTNNKKHDATT